MNSPPGQRPATLLLAAVLIAIEALAALVFAVLEIGQVEMSRPGVGVGVAVLMGGFGLLLLVVARGVLRAAAGAGHQRSRCNSSSCPSRGVSAEARRAGSATPSAPPRSRLWSGCCTHDRPRYSNRNNRLNR